MNSMAYRAAFFVFLLVAASGLLVTPATAQSVDNINVTLADESGDGLDDSITVEATVTDDGGSTGIEFDAPFSLNLSETDEGQADIVSINDDQAKENITFGSFGSYTGTYTVEGSLSNQSDGDTGNLTAWVGDTDREQADDSVTQGYTVLETDSPFFDENGDPLGEVGVVDRLVEWRDTGEINGVEYAPTEITGYLVEWNDAAKGGSGSVDALSVDTADTDGDGLDDTVSVNVSVTDDGSVTAVRFRSDHGDHGVDLSFDGSQSPVVVTDEEEQLVMFGGTGYTGTYEVEGVLSAQSDGDVGNVTAWVGDKDPAGADDSATRQYGVDATESGGTDGPVSVEAPSQVQPNSTLQLSVSVEGDGGVTVVEFDAPFPLNLSGTDVSQSAIVSINDDQPSENVTFGSTGYTGTYTVDAQLVGGSDGDTVGVASWTGDRQRPSADAEATGEVNVSSVTIEWCPSGVSRSVCGAFADDNGNPAGELSVVDALVEWNDNDQTINGEDVGELTLVDVLVAWNDAR